ncbi:uncharacterized protein LAESUDRAFT_739671 [Laetiporus sulphureus 93-53]|uniref:CBF1-interacting co-repressor CIR N-terminal domain-containing protein n=1 Tax=Laetiporus sulphureus 93-53 TaxID=1314785 RepID=A0A165B6K0_9APHY|nr:uncharacterized protein LAESUDRAFT_739671 [Laetiporus sulphureus 93-53]KZT00356.1 hypothetical protein LAESUDRAFT_739671 [Laetiporus sulphureus 93-53]
MGKLNIAHHKSYHPYRRDNIERVRRDEEEARLQEAVQEGKMMLADSEARIDLLRQRAGVKASKNRQDDDELDSQAKAGPSSITTGGHINLFEDLERVESASLLSQLVPVRSTKKEPPETEKGIPLAPPEKDLKPWYYERNHGKEHEVDEDRKIRDLARKSVNDPLTSINYQLSSRSASTSTTSHARRPPSSTSAANQKPPEVARLNRESSERQRALELIRRKKREMEGSETPSTVHGGRDEGYGDVFNRREVEEARRIRERRWDGHYFQDTRGARARW